MRDPTLKETLITMLLAAALVALGYAGGYLDAKRHADKPARAGHY